MGSAVIDVALRGCGRNAAAAAQPTVQLALPWRGEAKAADAAARRLRA
jgi:hypothetical protein